MAVTRLITADDAPALAERLQANREFLAAWGPDRGPRYFTVGGQRQVITDALALHERGTALPHVIVCDGDIVGRVTLSDITRGTLQSCNLGYWLSESHNGRGVATAAVGEMADIAFGQLGLHRIQAGTMPRNVRSQGVLRRNGFVRIGLAPAYLKIADRWEDHILYQLLSDREGGGGGGGGGGEGGVDAAR